ncbi:MAG: DUF2065 domain-containing protein [Alphaproteobacteria bacterium]|nr:DUF2065 domain-containing protein [Alphaproteobacteria bacterium]
MRDLLTALALVLVIEGALYALFPVAMRDMLTRMMEIPDRTLRVCGVVAVAVGVVAVWAIRG